MPVTTTLSIEVVVFLKRYRLLKGVDSAVRLQTKKIKSNYSRGTTRAQWVNSEKSANWYFFRTYLKISWFLLQVIYYNINFLKILLKGWRICDVVWSSFIPTFWWRRKLWQLRRPTTTQTNRVLVRACKLQIVWLIFQSVVFCSKITFNFSVIFTAMILYELPKSTLLFIGQMQIEPAGIIKDNIS